MDTGNLYPHPYTMGCCSRDAILGTALHSPYFDLDGTVFPPHHLTPTPLRAIVEPLYPNLTGNRHIQVRHWRWLYRNISFRINVEDRVYDHTQQFKTPALPWAGRKEVDPSTIEFFSRHDCLWVVSGGDNRSLYEDIPFECPAVIRCTKYASLLDS